MHEPTDRPDPVGAGAEGPAERAPIAWRPTPEQAAGSRLGRFLTTHGIADVPTLVERSTREPEWFWQAVVEDLGLEWYAPYDRVLDLSEGKPFARWFPGGRYNYVHNALDRHIATRGDQAALIWEGEDGTVRTLTYRELLAETSRLANALTALGVGRGDRVGIFLPMLPETAVAALAVSRIGAIYTPIFSGFGGHAVAERLSNCDAKVLITADGFSRRGGAVPMKETADEAAARVPSLEHLLVYRHLGHDVPWTAGRDVWWHELVGAQPATHAAAPMASDEPFMIIYTSGTTGRPKGALHVHLGFPLKGTQDMAHCFDVGPGDRLFWLTDLGWMMGPWAIIGALTLGATAVQFEGTPDYPGPDRLWGLVERHRVTHLGISPTAIRGLMRYGLEPVQQHDLSSLRVLGATGEPWNPESWWWYFEHVGGGRCPLINYSGGTEVSGGIIGCNLVQPIKPCSFSGPIPGIAADVVDDEGRSLRCQVGELVIREPWPGMTQGFWGDRERYLETYWSRLPDTWVHGDWAYVDEDGFWYIQGRSDDTLKVAGKRIGPAEVESAAVAHPAVNEAAAIGVPDEVKGESIVVFAVLAPGTTPSESLRHEVEEAVVAELGRPLRPKAVRFVRELPKTRSAKIMRRVIRARYLGRTDLGDLSSLENPSAIDAIAQNE